MCETFGQDASRSIFEWFLLFMNCCNMFFHVILDRKMNVSDTAESLATRIVWCCADVWNFWARSEAFNFWKVSPLHELQQCVFPSYSWSKLNLSDSPQTLATRIVWCCACVWDFWARSVKFNFWVSLLILLKEIQNEDWKLNLSDTVLTLATRIVWCCAHVWNFWARSKSFSFQVVSPHHELLQHVLPCYSWSKNWMSQMLLKLWLPE